MIFPLIGYLLHCTILMAYLGLSKGILLQSNILFLRALSMISIDHKNLRFQAASASSGQNASTTKQLSSFIF
jgi:hypothetical protein